MKDILSVQKDIWETLSLAKPSYKGPAFDYYSRLFWATSDYRLSIKAYADAVRALNKHPGDKCLEEILSKTKQMRIGLTIGWIEAINDLKSQAHRLKIYLQDLSELAEHNIEFNGIYQKRFEKDDDEDGVETCKEIHWTAKLIQYVLKHHLLYHSDLYSSQEFFKVEGERALKAAESGQDLDVNIPILRSAVKWGRVDQEEAHLAILKGKGYNKR